MGTNYYAVKKKPTIASPLHIGKSSAGWKFLFHEVKKYWCEYDEELEIHTFPQWKKWLEENIGKEYVMLDEYDREISLKDFFELVEEKQRIENKDNFRNAKNIDGYRFSDDDFS